ncbi:MAG: DUF1801 domain-containing protein [Chitinophagaceae bacterium]|nr:DUF1801 domain-containing protein [Chitinophagaceae bacterium]
MALINHIKIKSVLDVYDVIPEHERIMVDVLRGIILAQLPHYCKEKISFNVPYFYGNKGICIVWPAGIPRGGIKQGVLLGFWYGNRLADVDHYLTHGSNKQIFYRIFQRVEDIDEQAIGKLLEEAVKLDRQWPSKK